jgi:Effector Associated Constant Component 1
MNVEVSIDDPDQLDAVASLEDWLLNEPDLMGCPVTRLRATPKPGEMGALSDVLVVALGSGGMGVALARSLSVWLSTRVGQFPVRIRTANGEVEFRARNAEDAKALIEAITPLVSGSDSQPA